MRMFPIEPVELIGEEGNPSVVHRKVLQVACHQALTLFSFDDNERQNSGILRLRRNGLLKSPIAEREDRKP